MSFIVLSLTVLSILQRVTPLTWTTPVAAAWYAGWHATEGFPLSDVSWDKYNTLIFAFAITTPNVNNISLHGSDPSVLPDFVSEAHRNNVSAHVAIGGWDGSRWFSSNLATSENRTAFVQTVATFAEKYGIDGINFDWEYPNHQGIGCNTISANDTQNFLLFLQELRTNSVGAKLTISTATGLTPFADVDGHPSKNVTDFTKVLNYITIMNYDVWGSWSSSVGPNAPLNDTCAPPADQVGSAVSAVAAWTAAGMSIDQIVLGVPSFGHSFSVSPSDAFVNGSTTELAAYPKFNASNQPLGDAWGDTGSVDACEVYVGPGGTFNLWGLVDGGFLTTEGNAAPGIYYRYDACSQTPYVYNETSQVMISFDNAQSFAAKGNYILEAGLRGFAILIVVSPAGTSGLVDRTPSVLIPPRPLTRRWTLLMDEINEGHVTPTPNGETAEIVTGWPWQPHFPRSDDPSVGVDQRTYDNLVRYTKYASGAYQMLCPRPMGNTLIAQFQGIVASTKGFIARDDRREELVVAFRGTIDVTSILLDACIMLVSLEGPGLPPSDPSAVPCSAVEPRVHAGFLLAYNSVAQTVLDELEPQLQAYPSYNIVVCGHSLGGSISSIASIAITHTFPGKRVALYTFGQPRTGDRPFAELVERAIGTGNIYRCVHLVDGVPTMIPTRLGYRHFGAEYWQFTELGPPKNVKRLEGGEDPNGSSNIPSTGVNPAHWVYFRQPIASDPTVCI